MGIDIDKNSYQDFCDGKYGFVVMEGFYQTVDEEGVAARYTAVDKFEEDEYIYLNDGKGTYNLVLKDIYRIYTKKNRFQTLLTDTNLMSHHCCIIVSEKYISDIFDYDENQYQIVSVNAGSEANYEVTDKQLSAYGFKNQCLDLGENLKQAQESLLTTLIILGVLIVVSVIFTFIISKLYFYRCQDRIGLLKVIGVKNSKIIKMYLSRLCLGIISSILLSMLINHVIRANYYFTNELLVKQAQYVIVESKA